MSAEEDERRAKAQALLQATDAFADPLSVARVVVGWARRSAHVSPRRLAAAFELAEAEDEDRLRERARRRR